MGSLLRLALLTLGIAILCLTGCDQRQATPSAQAEPTRARPASEVVAPTAPTTDVADRLVEPGVSVGFITTQSEQDLQRLLGVQNVVRDAWYYGEGNYGAASVLWKGTDDEVWLIWKDDAYLVPTRAMIVGKNWHTREGFRVGMALPDVVKANG